MVLGKNKKEWKADYFVKMERLLGEYSKMFICNADNVSSKQFQNIRQGLRGQAEVLMGKNTMMKKCINNLAENNPDYEPSALIPYIEKNVALVMTNGDMKEIRDIIVSNKVQAPAKAGAHSDIDVYVPAQVTGLGPEKTSFFQALSIPTKINRGHIEITGTIHLLKIGDRVGQSDAALLNMLKISPFTYGLDILNCYDNGSVYAPEILDITEDDVRAKFMNGVNNIASVSLAIGYPTIASVPHSIANSFKNLMSIAAATDITFPQVESLKNFLADPSAFVVETVQEVAEVAEEAQKEESEESEEDDDFGFDLFG